MSRPRTYYVAIWAYGRASNPDGSPCRSVSTHKSAAEAEEFAAAWNLRDPGSFAERIPAKSVTARERELMAYEVEYINEV